MASGEIVNRVANSALVTIDLEDYYPKGARVCFDIKDWLYEGDAIIANACWVSCTCK